MRWLVDGYNVIRRDAELAGREAEGLEAGRRALLHLVAGAARRSGDAFTVVFDGARPGGGAPSAGQVSVVFSRPPETADQVLVRLAGALREGAIVVTSDRAVQTASRRAGAAVVSAEAFVAALAEGERDEEDDDAPSRHGGGPARRLSKDARATERALRRLRGR